MSDPSPDKLVFIVTDASYDDETVKAVFSTLDKAEAYVEKYRGELVGMVCINQYTLDLWCRDHRAYRKEHERCPACSSDVVETTTAWFPGYEVRDENRATCHSCEWVGIVHDLLPK